MDSTFFLRRRELVVLKPATLNGLRNAEAEAVYSHWLETMRLLSEKPPKQIQSMWVEDLKEIYAQAKALINSPLLNQQESVKLKIILSRPIDQWVILAGYSDVQEKTHIKSQTL